MATEKVTSARFIAKTDSSVTAAFDAPTAENVVAELYKNGLPFKTAQAVPVEDGDGYTAVFDGVAFDFAADYFLKASGVPVGCTVAKTALIDNVDFIKTFECEDTQSLEYGALYDKARTLFRVWAPFASAVKVKLYAAGSGGGAFSELDMKKRLVGGERWGGVWEAEREGDLNGVYYTYLVHNAGVTETIDPYAKAAGANGIRGMVVDLASTDPEGWEKDRHYYDIDPLGADTPIVWEVHVSDFSSSPDSGMRYKGGYLAFTEKGTTVPGRPDLKTGVDYLKELGVTYVQLNPVFDFATVDERETPVADGTKDTFNWGYDPQNYNIPEGSYSTDASRGEVRINEFKRMVKALHDAGIGVIMDVVYNHTYVTGGQALDDTVPKYYHRTDESGAFTDLSGCGNDTASERAMVRKYIIDSIVYWATEYHVDGFRFDLMGIHDLTTVRMARKALDALDGGRGARLLMYGEPWTGEYGSDTVPASHSARVAATAEHIAGTGAYTDNAGNRLIKKLYQTRDMRELPLSAGVFGDTGRDGLRGNNDPGRGWANGRPCEVYSVQKLLEGYCGTSGAGLTVAAGSQAVGYVSAHDNYTLWDQMAGKEGATETPLYYDHATSEWLTGVKLCSAAYMTSACGTVFMLAGEEMARTKYGNHNSYNSPKKVNMIRWARQAAFKEVVEHYKRLIAVRRANNYLFSYERSQEPSNCYGNFSVADEGSGRIVFARGNMTVDLDPATGRGTVIIDGNTEMEF